MVPFAAPVPEQFLALNQAAEADFLFAALCRLHEGKGDVDVDVVASNRRVGVAGPARTAEAAAKAASAAEEAVKDVADVAKVKAAKTGSSCSAAIVRVYPCMTKLVVTRHVFPNRTKRHKPR